MIAALLHRAGYIEKISISITSVENNIRYLKKTGIVRRIGPAKGGHWEVLDNDDQENV